MAYSSKTRKRILDTLDASDWSNWMVHDEGIYFIDRSSGNSNLFEVMPVV